MTGASPKILKPPIPYFGSKAATAERIVAQFPPHQHYVEPFAGSLSVLLAKPQAQQETVNDLDGALITFWRVLRDQPDALARVCALTPHSRAEHACVQDLDGIDDLEVARRVWVQLAQGRNATRRASGTGWRYQVGSAIGRGIPDYLHAYVDRIAACAERLASVTLECRPALEIIERFGRDGDVLLYCDPPYVANTRGWGNNYAVEMRDDADHEQLADALHGCNAAVVLSGYASDLYDSLYDGWHRVDISAHTAQSTAGARVEVLWCNRPVVEDLFSAHTTHPTCPDCEAEHDQRRCRENAYMCDCCAAIDGAAS